MRYRALADVVVVVHFGFVLFVVAGVLAVVWKPWLAWLHVPCMLYGAAIEVVGKTCPLTPLENRLRRAGGGREYDGSFLRQYVARAVHPALWKRVEPWLGALVLVGNVAVYGYLVIRLRGG